MTSRFLSRRLWTWLKAFQKKAPGSRVSRGQPGPLPATPDFVSLSSLSDFLTADPGMQFWASVPIHQLCKEPTMEELNKQPTQQSETDAILELHKKRQAEIQSLIGTLDNDEIQAMLAIDKLCDKAYKTAAEKGFWDDYFETLNVLAGMANPVKRDRLVIAVKKAFFGQKMDLMHSELGELTEAARKDLPADKLPAELFSGEEEELADVLIRAFDYAGKRKFSLGLAVVLKMRYNSSRPYKHGKQF